MSIAEERTLRIYGSLRTAQLERLSQMDPSLMWYLDTRPDFDESLIDLESPPVQMSLREILLGLTKRHFERIEVNEPALVAQWKLLIPVLLILRIRGFLTRKRSTVVSYCIENFDPATIAQQRWGLSERSARLLAWIVMQLLVRGSDRLAFGSRGSQHLYESYVGKACLNSRSWLFEALPSRCACLSDAHSKRDSDGVLFLGAFVNRKGILPTLDAWQTLQGIRPETRFTLIGAGSLQPQVESWAVAHGEVCVLLDPPREQIHRALRENSVLVLLPQKEQLGLPILEALSHGCEVVTNSETGLASWLAAHGHEVLPPDSSAEAVADAIAMALDRAALREGSLKDLPTTDQRIEADHWLATGGSG